MTTTPTRPSPIRPSSAHVQAPLPPTATSPTPAVPRPYEMPGPKILLVGATGSGKTHSIRTLVEAGKEVFVLFTEPGMEGLSDIPPEQLHWCYIPPAAPDWAELIDAAKKINTMAFKALAEMGDINKRKYGEFVNILQALANFTCDRTGEQFGGVETWGPERAIVIDSLSGINLAAMNLVVGGKPVKSMADWGMAMDTVERFVTKFCTGISCTGVMIAHAEREADEITGGIQVMASTLGKKLAPKIPRNFSDVIFCKRKGDQFSWSTAEHNVDVKTRNLPISGTLPPSFVPLLAAWEKRKAAGQAAPKS